jgi:hypothetical protein
MAASEMKIPTDPKTLQALVALLKKEDDAMLKAVLHPTIKADEKGNVTVPAAKLQQIMDMLEYSQQRTSDISRLTRNIIRDISQNLTPSIFDQSRLQQLVADNHLDILSALTKMRLFLPLANDVASLKELISSFHPKIKLADWDKNASLSYECNFNDSAENKSKSPKAELLGGPLLHPCDVLNQCERELAQATVPVPVSKEVVAAAEVATAEVATAEVAAAVPPPDEEDLYA